MLPPPQVRAGVDDLKTTVTDVGGESAVLVLTDGQRKPHHRCLVYIGQVTGEHGQHRLGRLLVARAIRKLTSVQGADVAGGIVGPQASFLGTHKQRVAGTGSAAIAGRFCISRV